MGVGGRTGSFGNAHGLWQLIGLWSSVAGSVGCRWRSRSSDGESAGVGVRASQRAPRDRSGDRHAAKRAKRTGRSRRRHSGGGGLELPRRCSMAATTQLERCSRRLRATRWRSASDCPRSHRASGGPPWRVVVGGAGQRCRSGPRRPIRSSHLNRALTTSPSTSPTERPTERRWSLGPMGTVQRYGRTSSGVKRRDSTARLPSGRSLPSALVPPIVRHRELAMHRGPGRYLLYYPAPWWRADESHRLRPDRRMGGRGLVDTGNSYTVPGSLRRLRTTPARPHWRRARRCAVQVGSLRPGPPRHMDIGAGSPSSAMPLTR